MIPDHELDEMQARCYVAKEKAATGSCFFIVDDVEYSIYCYKGTRSRDGRGSGHGCNEHAGLFGTDR